MSAFGAKRTFGSTVFGRRIDQSGPPRMIVQHPTALKSHIIPLEVLLRLPAKFLSVSMISTSGFWGRGVRENRRGPNPGLKASAPDRLDPTVVSKTVLTRQ